MNFFKVVYRTHKGESWSTVFVENKKAAEKLFESWHIPAVLCVNVEQI